MTPVMPYGDAIRDAIASRSITKMKSMLKRAKEVSSKQGNLALAIIELTEAIQKLEKKK